MAAKKAKIREANVEQLPHNGHPDYQETDPLTGEQIGGQRLMLRDLLNFQTFTIAVGRRFGKTTGIRYLFPMEASITPGIYRAGFIAPDHNKAYAMFTETMKAYGGDPRNLAKGKASAVIYAEGDSRTQRRFFRTGPIITERGQTVINEGMELWFWSGQHPHYEKIRGGTHHFNRVHLDEAVQLHPKILNVVNPMLMEAEAKCGIPGKLSITTTPDVDAIGNEWVESYFTKGMDDTEPDFGCMSFPSYAAPEDILSRKAIAAMKARCRNETAWLQEGMAEFLSGQGSVFSHINEVHCLDPIATPEWFTDLWKSIYCREGALGGDNVSIYVHESPIPGTRYVIGLDWARMRDATIISIFNMETLEQACLMVLRNEDWEEQAEWASELHLLYNRATMFSDQHGIGDSQTRVLQRRFKGSCIGVKDWGVANRKARCVRDTQHLFNHVEIKMLNVEPQRSEFKAYTAYPNDDNTRIKFSHKPEGHDDTVDAVLMISEYLMQGKRSRAPEKPQGPRWMTLDWLRDQRKKRHAREKRRASRI